MKISLVTAAWNSAETISDTMRSVNAQTHADVEHIVIDGGSSDATLAIVRAEGQRVAVVVSEADAGLYDAMNKGIRMARGAIIGLLNSDDCFASPDVLKTVASAFEDDPELDAVYGDLCYVRRTDPSRIVRYWRSSAFQPGLFGRGWAPPHPTLYVRRSVYERFGDFDLAYPLAADLELMIRFLERGRIRTRHIAQVFVNMRTGGATNSGVVGVVRQNREIWRALRKHGFAGSLPAFVVRKLAARVRQLLTRPAAA